MKRNLPQICFAALFLIVLHSCSKSSNNNNPVPPTVKPDTLATGWTKIPVSVQGAVDVFFNTAATGYSFFDGCYKTTDGGLTWAKLPFAFGNAENMAVTNDGKIFIVGNINTIFRSIDGGANFTTNTISGSGPFTDIFFSDNNNGFTASSTGLYQTTDGGNTWNLVNPSTGLILTPPGYSSSYFISPTTGWITSGNLVFKSNGSINSWTKSNFTGTQPSVSVMSIYAASPTVIFTGCGDGNVFKSIDGGVNFSLVAGFAASAGGSSGYLDVHFTSVTNGYASYGNRIYKTTDGGNSWVPVVALGNAVFTEIHFVDANHGWGCTSKGEILRYFQ